MERERNGGFCKIICRAVQNNQQLIRVQSQFLSAEIKGKYKLTQLADIIQQSSDPYFLLCKKNTNRVDAHDFTITAKAF